MTVRRIGALALVACVWLGGEARPAASHAWLERSEPAPGAVLPADRPPAGVSLWFSEPVAVAANAVAVLDGERRRVERLNAHVAAVDPRRVGVDLAALAPGAYLVRWHVTSADNHVVGGSYWFVVGFAPVPPPTPTLLGTGAPAVPWVEVAARWLGLVVLLVLTGAPGFDLLVRRPLAARLAPHPEATLAAARPGPVVWLLVTAVFAVAQLLSAAAQVEAVAELPLPQALGPDVVRVVLFESRFAALWWVRLGLGLALGGWLARGSRAEGGAAVLAAVLLTSTAFAGHAAGARIPTAPAIAADALHLAAAAVWLGGLVQLAWLLGSALPTAPSESRAALLRVLVPRFSRVALASVAVLVATGVANGYAQAVSPPALLETAYGESLLVKLVLLLPWLGLAAANRLLVRPRMAAGRAATEPRLPHAFGALVRAEIGVGAAVLGTVALLTSLPPSGGQGRPSTVEVARQAGDLRVGFRVDPNWVGRSRFGVTLADARGLPPTEVERVTLTFTMDGMNMGRTHVTATPRGPGVYEADGFYVGMPGLSQVGVAVSRAGGVDRSTVFRIEVPDVNAAQLAGLRASLGLGPLALVGLGLGLAATVALPGTGRRIAAAGIPIAVLVGTAGVLVDHRLAGPEPVLVGNPAGADPGSLARGREVYRQQCAVCHGEHGAGDGPASASLLPPPADLTLHARWHAEAQLYWFVTHGVPGTSMLGFADRLGSHDRWDVVNWLRALASASTATVARAGASPGPSEGTGVPAGSSSTSPARSTRSRPAPTSPATAPPVPAGPAGRLVFGPDFDNNLWLLRLPDGRPGPLTRFSALEFSSNPAWSPDGRQIAFSYYRLPGEGSIPVPDGTDLYRMNADGSDVRVLAGHDAPGAALQYPAWAADGRAVYVSYVRRGGAGSGVDRVEVRSGVRTRVVPNAGFPTLSRDGRRLAYVLFAAPPARGQSLWWGAPDGSQARPVLGPDAFDKLFGLRFAPDGSRLLFAAVGPGPAAVAPSARRLDPLGLLGRLLGGAPAYANGDLWDLWTVELDGSHLRRLTTLSEDLPVAAWAPDGRSIAFLGGGSASTAEAGLTLMDSRGQGRRRLTTQPGHRGLDWARAAGVPRRP